MNLFKKTEDKTNLHFFPKIKRQDFLSKKTPVFYTDINIVKKQYFLLKKAIETNWLGKYQIAFSFKTNYELAKVIAINIPNISAEIVSEMEYKLAKSLSFPDSKIIYNGSNKNNFHNIIKKRNIINIDNQSEVIKLIENKSEIKSKIGIRLNSNIKKSRFGFNIENNEIKEVINTLKKRQIKINGLHIHLGFYTPPKTYFYISQKIIKIIRDNNLKLNYIDFGGGFPSHGQKPYGYKKYTYHSINEYILQICKPLNNFFINQINKPTLIFEPGRFLVDDSTSLITKIINQQITNNKQVITVDTTNHMLSSVWFRPQIVKPVFIINHQEINTIIYGSSCQEDDILYQGQFPIVEVNSPISFYCVGAYNQNMCANFIYTKPKTYFNITNKANKN